MRQHLKTYYKYGKHAGRILFLEGDEYRVEIHCPLEDGQYICENFLYAFQCLKLCIHISYVAHGLKTIIIVIFVPLDHSAFLPIRSKTTAWNVDLPCLRTDHAT